MMKDLAQNSISCANSLKEITKEKWLQGRASRKSFKEELQGLYQVSGDAIKHIPITLFPVSTVHERAKVEKTEKPNTS